MTFTSLLGPLRPCCRLLKRHALLLLLLFFFLVIFVDGISVTNKKPLHCYKCNSANDKRCGDTFDNTTMYLHRCPSNATMCTKVVVWIEGFPERIYRDCAYHGQVGWDEGRWCEARKGSFWSRAWYCYCNDKHGCNSAAKLQNGATLLFCLTVALIFGSTGGRGG